MLRWFQKAIGWRIGDGDKARFWEDSWFNSISLDQGLTVGEVGEWVDLV